MTTRTSQQLYIASPETCQVPANIAIKQCDGKNLTWKWLENNPGRFPRQSWEESGSSNIPPFRMIGNRYTAEARPVLANGGWEPNCLSVIGSTWSLHSISIGNCVEHWYIDHLPPSHLPLTNTTYHPPETRDLTLGSVAKYSYEAWFREIIRKEFHWNDDQVGKIKATKYFYERYLRIIKRQRIVKKWKYHWRLQKFSFWLTQIYE